jgi:hypothetical protein
MKPKAKIQKRKSAAHSKGQTLQSEIAGTETSWMQSSDFFRISNVAFRISSESASLKQFNSEF